MANIYIVTKQIFHKDSNNFDIAFACSACDIIAFSNWSKAEEFVKEQVSAIESLNDNGGKFDVYCYDKNECRGQGVEKMSIYSQQLYNSNGIRYCFRITKQKVN
jgi:hypothetical protein